MTSRKQIFAALFALVSGNAAFVTKSRTVKNWSEVGPADQPALFQVEGKQDGQVHPAAGTKWTFHAELVLYAHQANTVDGADVVDLLNELVDTVLTAIAPGPAFDQQTLGGLVTDCRVEGTIDTSEGRLGSQAVAIIPVVIIATN
jgi:hypothetical protein